MLLGLNDDNNIDHIERPNWTFLQSRSAANTYAQVARAQSCANHVQRIQRLSRAACRVTCHVVRKDSSAIQYDSVNRIYFCYILLAESLTDEGGEETVVPGENLWRRASEMPHTKARRLKPRARLEPAHLHWWQAWVLTVLQ